MTMHTILSIIMAGIMSLATCLILVTVLTMTTGELVLVCVSASILWFHAIFSQFVRRG